MLRNVAVVVVNGFLPFEFGTICEVFGVDRADDGLPSYVFAVVAGRPAPLRAHNDFTIQPSCGLERLEEADLIALPAVGDDRLCFFRARPRLPRRPAGPDAPREFPDDLLRALRRAVDRGARVLSVCSGAFILVRPACWMAAAAPRTGGTRRNWPASTPPPRSIRMSSTSTTTR